MVRDLWHVGEQLRVRAGETLCHITYLDMSCSLACVGARCRALPQCTPPPSLRQQMMEPPLSRGLLDRRLQWRRPNVAACFPGAPISDPRAKGKYSGSVTSSGPAGRPDRHRSLFPVNYHTFLLDGQTCQGSRSSVPIGLIIPGSQENRRCDGRFDHCKCASDNRSPCES